MCLIIYKADAGVHPLICCMFSPKSYQIIRATTQKLPLMPKVYNYVLENIVEVEREKLTL